MPGMERHALGEWVLRAARAATGRANSTWPVGGPACPVTEAVDVVERWYGARGLRPMFQVFDGAPGAVVAELDRRGYVEVPGALVMAASMTDPGIERTCRSAGDGPEVRTSAGPTAPFAALVGDDDRVTEMAATDRPQRYVTVHAADGTTLGGGLATLDGRAVGVFAMRTVGPARRSGVATRVLGSLLAAARADGADTVWLQVMADNVGARTLYERLGMTVVHHYGYRASPPGSG